MATIRKQLDAAQLLTYALRALERRALSAGEARRKLKERALVESDIDGVIVKLKEYGYLDDQRFAETFAANRKESQGLGRQRVMRDLRQRRVAPSVAEKAVEGAYAEADEPAMIEAFLARKFRSVNLSVYLKEDKNLASMYRKLVYAGFGGSNAIKVLKRYAARADELAED